jgi:hypothetical protein
MPVLLHQFFRWKAVKPKTNTMRRQRRFKWQPPWQKKKKLVEAVQLLQQKLQHCFSKKETLTWRLALSQVLIESQRLDLALPHLDLILKDIDTYQLASWDPGLALKGYKLVWTGFNSHKDNEFKKSAQTILNRIAELDPVEALVLKK